MGQKLGVMAHACHLSNSGKLKIEGSQSRLPELKKARPISKITRAKRAGGMGQVAEYLLCPHEAQNLSPSTIKKKKIRDCP
jgi:hypothetical protein